MAFLSPETTAHTGFPLLTKIYSHPPKVPDKACRRRQYVFVRRGDATPYEAFGGWLWQWNLYDFYTI